MNDLPKNELFSAYLDGELSAAEQAEMERLLATNPAARQLLDELHALTNALQSLPQEKLGDDLSPHVLRAAERRMLTGEAPIPAEAAPVPLAKSVLRNMLSRRTIVWLSLTTAVALIIAINERRQCVEPVQVARSMVESPVAANNRVVMEPRSPPMIRAVRDGDLERSKDEKITVVGNRAADAPASAPMPAEKPAAPAKGATETESGRAERGLAAGNAGGTFSGGEKAPEDNDGGLGLFRRDRVAGQEAGKTERTKKAGMAREAVVVVRCDINSQAAKQRPLERLLDANGITWRKPADVAQSPPAAQSRLTQPKAAVPQALGRREFVYDVEGTAAQIKATLAGLAAQPDVFLSFSVNPPQDKLAPTRLEFEQRTQVSGPQTGPGAVGQLDVVVRQQAQQQPAGGSQSAAALLEKKRQGGDQAKQRVLFVLHVVGGDRLPAAAESPDRPTAAPAQHQ